MPLRVPSAHIISLRRATQRFIKFQPAGMARLSLSSARSTTILKMLLTNQDHFSIKAQLRS